jgi:hypothetical protein
MRKPRSCDSVHDALEATARTYRRNLWRDTDDVVEIWVENRRARRCDLSDHPRTTMCR